MGYRTITYTYDRIQAFREHRGVCPACGKKVIRRRTFEHTVNPFNRNEDGTVRTREQVRERVNAEADEWVPDFRHNTEQCRGGAAS